MCQLLGMNCADRTDFSFSLKGFCQRGGATDIHSHGWGVCVHEGNGLRSFHDTLPAAVSPLAELLQNYPIRTYVSRAVPGIDYNYNNSHRLSLQNMMAHIRYATQGEVSLENVHPFSRVWKGVQMTFCHNGECFVNGGDPPLLAQTRPEDVIYHAVGDTDSEAVFCAILNAMHVELPEETIFNFLLGCGQYTLFAYSWPGKRPGSNTWNGLYYLIRQPPFSTAKLLDADYEIDFEQVTTPSDRVAVIATKPLTEEAGWTEFKRGELLMFDKGLPYRTPKCCEVVEREGRGLFSKALRSKCSSKPVPLCISVPIDTTKPIMCSKPIIVLPSDESSSSSSLSQARVTPPS